MRNYIEEDDESLDSMPTDESLKQLQNLKFNDNVPKYKKLLEYRLPFYVSYRLVIPNCKNPDTNDGNWYIKLRYCPFMEMYIGFNNATGKYVAYNLSIEKYIVGVYMATVLRRWSSKIDKGTRIKTWTGDAVKKLTRIGNMGYVATVNREQCVWDLHGNPVGGHKHYISAITLSHKRGIKMGAIDKPLHKLEGEKTDGNSEFYKNIKKALDGYTYSVIDFKLKS